MEPTEAICLLRDPHASFGNDVSLRIATCIQHLTREVARLAQPQLALDDIQARRADRESRRADLLDECDAMAAHQNAAARGFSARVASYLVLDDLIERTAR